MLEAIKHGLGNLLNFGGRDARPAFWYYVLFVYLVSFAISMVVAVPMTIQAIVGGVRQGIATSQSGDPLAGQAATEAAITNAMTDMMSTLLWVGLATNLLMIVLLGAAFVRRLHDSDLAGWWALIPGAAQVANLFVAPALVGRMTASMSQMQAGDPAAGMRAMQSSMSAASLLGWAALIVIVALGVRKSTPGPNRHGEAPFTV